MHRKARKAILVASTVLLASAGARAQPADPIGQILGQPVPAPTYRLIQQPAQSVQRPLSYADAQAFGMAMAANKRGDVTGARSAIAGIGDTVARKTATWGLVDANAEALSFYEIDQARRELLGWPRPARRQIAAEKLLEISGKTPAQVVEWFAGAEPQSAYGALALAQAYRMQGQPQPATALVRRWWRDKSFEADAQRSFLARFADVLTMDDHARRADVMLYGPHGPATRDIVALLPADAQAAAQARIALRANASNANDLHGALVGSASASPGVAFERAAYMRRRGMDTIAVGQLANFPREIVTSEQAARIWDERYQLVLSSLRNRDARSAYAAAANSGLTTGGDAADAEFYAGWIALTKLNDPQAAGRHFAALAQIGASPITRGRALYWQGRAADARRDPAAAQGFYTEGARHVTTFYGQLAAEKIGQRLVLPADPRPTADDRARFEAHETVQAMRLLADQGQRDLFKVFALHQDDIVPDVTEAVLLVDAVRGYGDQDTSMKVVRAAAQRGLILADRGYPVRTPPQVANGPETALVMGITRQESGFDPLVRSGVGARGMMQLMPSTAVIVARQIGVGYSPGMLDEPDYNMRLGASYLGQLVSQFSGSYVMATAGYNAGPGRPIQWSSFCGDPRGGATDPIDFIECIPFSETRNYVMRVMEGMQVYRAKQNGGSAPITLASDLRRGSYSYPGALPSVASSGP
ncbi:transglycosylase SLT domain-containing protein [Phenylobacterium sp.]|uniref:lytic transglycosylase domain-containing protein n=1 Tax=Phenylobacterium sp. TaxID=1871053 RepID=UPI0039839EA6